MLIVWGRRYYGTIDAIDGQYAMTKFGHLWFVPLFPMASMWVTVEGGERRGHAMRLSLRSVLHGYARGWAVVGGLIALVTAVASASVVAGAAAVGAGAIGLASLRARTMRAPRARRRAQLTRMTLGTACDPLAMPRDTAASFRPVAERRWARHADTLTPDDVARRGPSSPEQAAAAYTLLRILARTETGAKRRQAWVRSEQILDGAAELTLAGTPYRDELPAITGDGAAPASEPAKPDEATAA